MATSIPQPKTGRPSKYRDLLEQLIKRKKPYLVFKSRSHADSCRMYFLSHFRTGVCAVRKESDKEFRVYVEVE